MVDQLYINLETNVYNYDADKVLVVRAIMAGKEINTDSRVDNLSHDTQHRDL